MNEKIRPFAFTDIPRLYRYREQGLYLACAQSLIWGTSLVPASAMLSPLASGMGVFTAVMHADDKHIIIQARHTVGSSFARLTFISPDHAVTSPEIPPMIEYIILQVGERGAQNLIADVDEKSQTFEALRGASFSIYARQRIWKISQLFKDVSNREVGWRKAIPRDEFHIRKLYHSIVPALIQQVEPHPWSRLQGWVYFEEGELLAFVDVLQGPRGIWIQPFIHPEMQNINALLSALFDKLKPKNIRPLYVCLRSYQSWLSSAMEDFHAEAGSSQAVMVRRLTANLKMPAQVAIPQINGKTEPTASYYKHVPGTEDHFLKNK